MEDVERTQEATTQDPASDGEPSLEALQAELEQIRKERDELLDDLQRARAEFINFRRRVEQEREQQRQRAAEDLLTRLLPVADDFDRALRSVPAEIESHPWFEGIRLVERKLWRVLESEGVTAMVSVGQPFDPGRHDAVMVDEEGGTADTVIAELQRGYMLGDRVLRPAMVKVGAAAALPPRAEAQEATGEPAKPASEQ